MKRADPMRAARQSRHDANARKRKARAAQQTVFGSWKGRAHRLRPASPSPLHYAAASLALGKALALSPALERQLFGPAFNPETGRYE